MKKKDLQRISAVNKPARVPLVRKRSRQAPRIVSERIAFDTESRATNATANLSRENCRHSSFVCSTAFARARARAHACGVRLSGRGRKSAAIPASLVFIGSPSQWRRQNARARATMSVGTKIKQNKKLDIPQRHFCICHLRIRFASTLLTRAFSPTSRVLQDAQAAHRRSAARTYARQLRASCRV